MQGYVRYSEIISIYSCATMCNHYILFIYPCPAASPKSTLGIEATYERAKNYTTATLQRQGCMESENEAMPQEMSSAFCNQIVA